MSSFRINLSKIARRVRLDRRVPLALPVRILAMAICCAHHSSRLPTNTHRRGQRPPARWRQRLRQIRLRFAARSHGLGTPLARKLGQRIQARSRARSQSKSRPVHVRRRTKTVCREKIRRGRQEVRQSRRSLARFGHGRRFHVPRGRVVLFRRPLLQSRRRIRPASQEISQHALLEQKHGPSIFDCPILERIRRGPPAFRAHAELHRQNTSHFRYRWPCH